jgi:hypothetical protein
VSPEPVTHKALAAAGRGYVHRRVRPHLMRCMRLLDRAAHVLAVAGGVIGHCAVRHE